MRSSHYVARRGAITAVAIATLAVWTTSSGTLGAGATSDQQSQQPITEGADASAQYELGARYARGRGVPLNYAAAVALFRKAAEQGHVEAAYNLGVMYADGRGVRQDLAEAVKWLRK